MSLLDILEFEAPLSRVEEILQNILGASNEVDPESRVEKLLQNLIEVAYEVDPDSRVELLLDNLLGGHNEVVPMSRVEMLIANALGESYDVVPQSRVEELLVLLAEQYAVEYKTISGSVVSISDAIEAPMKSLKVAIEPVQDLHGQESPYPAGGGKNKYNKDGTDTDNGYMSGKYLKPNGDFVFNNAWEVSEYIPVEANAQYTLSGVSGTIPSIGFYDSNRAFLGGESYGGVSPKTFTTPTNTTYARLSVAVETTNVTQFELGSAATTFAPYSNICPITGWTGAQVVRTGKNLIDEASVRNYNNWSATVAPSGIMPSTDSNKMWSLPKLMAGETYTISFGISESAFPYYLYFGYYSNGEGTRLAYITTNTISSKTFTFTAIEGVTYCIRMGSITTEPQFNTQISRLSSIQLELNSTATDYEPYTGNTYSVSWESEAGTVYGGTLDVVSGELVVTHGTIDLGSLTWSYYADKMMFLSSVPTMENPEGASVGNITCDGYKTYSYNGMFNNASIIGIAGRAKTATKGLAVRDTRFGSDTTAFESAVSGIMTTYPLAEPITYHLTPTEVRTLLGQNNVWADTGDVEVTYLTKKH